MSERSKILKINDNIAARGSVNNIKNISNYRFSRLPPNIKDSIRRILSKRDLIWSQLKPLLYPNVKDLELSDCSLPNDDLLIVSEILRNQLNGLLSLFIDVPASEKLVVATKSLPEPEYFLIGKPCSSSWCLHVFYQVLTSCKWFNRSSTTSQSILPVICQNKLTLRDRQLLNNMPGMCGSWSDKDRMRLGAKLEDVVHHVKVQQMDASGAQGVHGLGLILPVQPPQSRSSTSRRRLLFLIIPTVAKYLVPEQYCK